MSAIVAAGIGNTTVRLGVTAQMDPWPCRWGGLLELETGQLDFSRLAEWLPVDPVAWFVASVNRPAESALASWVQAHRPADAYRLCSYEQIPLAMNVPTPDRVGMDRLMTALAGSRLREAGSPLIIVDAGTAVTIDVLDAEGTFQGGAILPGMRMAAAALAAGTDLLPQVDWRLLEQPSAAIGKGTEPAIRSGLFYGAVGSIAELIRRIKAELPARPGVIATGGDARRLAHLVDPDAILIEDLGLQGTVALAKHLAD